MTQPLFQRDYAFDYLEYCCKADQKNSEMEETTAAPEPTDHPAFFEYFPDYETNSTVSTRSLLSNGEPIWAKRLYYMINKGFAGYKNNYLQLVTDNLTASVRYMEDRLQRDAKMDYLHSAMDNLTESVGYIKARLQEEGDRPFRQGAFYAVTGGFLMCIALIFAMSLLFVRLKSRVAAMQTGAVPRRAATTRQRTGDASFFSRLAAKFRLGRRASTAGGDVERNAEEMELRERGGTARQEEEEGGVGQAVGGGGYRPVTLHAIEEPRTLENRNAQMMSR